MNDKYMIAITGPSGAGKTTLGNNLVNNKGFVIPRHCTTREKRNDDVDNFYRYFTHDVYRMKYEQGKFLISSGDGPEIKKEYGNFYGILKEDCNSSWDINDVIITFVSYKDIEKLLILKEQGIKIGIVNLTFYDIEKGVYERLSNNVVRNHTEKDIKSRIKWALHDEEIYGDILKKNATSMVYTDFFGIDETYEKVVKELKL